MNKLLVIGHTHPEPATTAAGVRMMQLIDLFKEAEYTINFATTSEPTEKSADLESLGIRVDSIDLNDSSFDRFVADLNPDVVMFDRFMTEEQFGWRVAEICPNALRILDTEDLHFLRKARQQVLLKGTSIEDELFSDLAKRELASIHRSDLSLIISGYEMEILLNLFRVPEEILFELPLFYKTIGSSATFGERSHFVTIGNFMHEPNADSVYYLKKSIWPLVRTELPEAELHIYGAYAPKEIQKLHNEAEGFLIKGWAADVPTVMNSARVCLSPVRFGAGLKGKILDALSCGTPVVTTAVGAEGIRMGHMFPGKVAEVPSELAAAAVQLYSEENQWEKARSIALNGIEKNYNQEAFSAIFTDRVETTRRALDTHRKRNFTGQILQHHTIQSTKYMSKWIEAKNSKK